MSTGSSPLEVNPGPIGAPSFGGKRILLTGGSGFIGSCLGPLLDGLGHTVYPVSRSTGFDISNVSSFRPFLGASINTVIHLAGHTFVPESWNSPDEYYRVNSLGTQSALDFCRAVDATMIYISAYIYGKPQYLPIDEQHPVEPNNPYAHSKWFGEELCRFYSRFMGVRTIILRPFNLYGPGQDERFLIPTILTQYRNNGVVNILDTTPRRDFLHVADFAEACASAVTHEVDYALFNVGSGYSLSVAEIVQIMSRVTGDKITVTATGTPRRNEILETIADIRAIKDAMGWTPHRSFSEGLLALVRTTNHSHASNHQAGAAT